MLKDYVTDCDAILINGDSYSAQGANQRSYGAFLSDSLGIPVHNIAFAGSSNDRIVRSTIENLDQFKQQYKNPLVVIGWSYIRRIEVWYYGKENQQVMNLIPDRINKDHNDALQPKFATLNVLVNHNVATVEQKCLVEDTLFVHKQLTDFYTNLYLIANHLALTNTKYFMFSGADNTDAPIEAFPYINSLQQVQWCKNNSHILNMHKFCISNWAKDNDPECHKTSGHLSQTGHGKFAKFLIEETNC